MESYNKKCKEFELHIFILNHESKIAGYSIVIDKPKENVIYAWYGGILPEYQGKHLSCEVFSFFMNFARILGRKYITVATTNNRPHMIRFIINMGYEVYDLKKRNDSSCNKIYFRKYVSNQFNNIAKIHLIKDNMHLSPSEIERQLVISYQQGATIYIFYGINNWGTLDYATNYLNSFGIRPEIRLNGYISRDRLQELQNKYKGTVSKDLSSC